MNQKQLTIVVAIIKNNLGQILLAKRNQPDIPEEHEKWEFVGGGIDFGESPEEAVVREAKEECGLNVKVLRLIPKIISHTWENQNPKRQIIILSYECEVVGGDLQIKDKEVSELKFVNVTDVKNYDCLPNVETILNLFNQ